MCVNTSHHNPKYDPSLGKHIEPSAILNYEEIMELTQNHPQLTPAAEFQRSGRCPVNLRWVIFHQKDSLEDHGAIIRFGKRRWLVDEDKFINWLRENGSSFSTPGRKNN